MRKLRPVVVASAVLLAACQTGTGVTMWGPCSPHGGSGTDTAYVLICRDGTWEPVMTVAEFVRIRRGLRVEIAKLPTRPTSTTTTSPAPQGTTSSTSTTVAPTSAPIVFGLTPSSGPAGGATSVTINGSNLTGATVTFDGTAATGLIVHSASQITVTAPAHASGSVDVVVTTPAGTNANTTADNYSYIATPTITSIAPVVGPASGGTSVVIRGTGFTTLSEVSFGGTPSDNFAVNSSTRITAVTPSRAAGLVGVQVTGPGGASDDTTADDFTFYAQPTVTGLTPNSGPANTGTTVTITGTGFTGATGVVFGMFAGSTMVVLSDTSISVTSPNFIPGGTIDVRVTSPGGTSPNTPADNYTYS